MLVCESSLGHGCQLIQRMILGIQEIEAVSPRGKRAAQEIVANESADDRHAAAMPGNRAGEIPASDKSAGRKCKRVIEQIDNIVPRRQDL